MQESLPILLTIEILEYEKKGSAVYYYIEIQANNTKKWKLEKRFSEIEEMHKKLVKKINDIPYLPAKSIFQIMGEDLEKRRNDLEKYLNVLASRRDVLNDLDFKNFLEIEKHYKTESLTVIKQVCEIANFPRGVKDFLYIPQKGLLFLLLAETNVVSKLGTIISNLSNKTSKEELSSVLLYKEETLGSLEFTKIWKKSFTTEASLICLDPTTPYLAIGFSNGSVTCLKLENNDYSKNQEFCNIFCHNQDIKGMAIIPDNGHLISISTDKYLIKADVIHNEGKLSERQHSNALTALLPDHQNKRFFVADSMGSLFIYSMMDRMELLGSIISGKENWVRTFFYDPLRNLLLSGSNKGIITIYEIGRSGKEKLSSVTGSFETIKNIRSLHFIAEKREIFVANSEGNVALVNTLSTEAFHVHAAHQGEGFKMAYIENKKLMITTGGDKTMRFWRYPYDPKEKIVQKTIDQSGEMLSSSNPAEQYKIQKKQEEAKSKHAVEEDEEEEDEASKGPLTLLRYQPAVEPKFDNEEEVEEEVKPKITKKKDSKKEEPEKKNKKGNKGQKKALFSDDDEDNEEEERPQPNRKKEGEASPKSFLFKNSIESVVKKNPTEQTVVPKKKEEAKVNVNVEPVKEQKKKEAPPVESKKHLLDQNTGVDPLIPGGNESSKKEKTQPKKTQETTTVKPKSNNPTVQSVTQSKPVVSEVKKIEVVDDDKPLNFEELKKTSNYVPLTFKKSGNESEDEELSGWNG